MRKLELNLFYTWALTSNIANNYKLTNLKTGKNLTLMKSLIMLVSKLKKINLILVFSFTTILFANAQEIGVRFGDIASGNNVALDGVFSTSKFSRIHADISFGHGVGIDVLWDFAYRPLGGEAFNWYAGVGPYIRIDDPFNLGIAGELGLEYKFKSVPIALGLDWRPGLNIIESTDFHAGGFGLNVRYVFGK